MRSGRSIEGRSFNAYLVVRWRAVVQRFGKFVHDYFAAGILLAVLIPAILYKPIRDSSPVAHITEVEGRIVTIIDNGPNRWGQKAPQFRYQIVLTENGEVIFVRDPYLRRVGSIVLIENVIRRNGYETSRIISPPALQISKRDTAGQ
jgi:hypothetical protein